MGYQALLFCPDERTARTLTQVLSELEFNVEASTEPFAAVKKLMGQHFDAVVVDCDNEQNATLLFKSARNSTSNQASLAVAVVEGQAGVAKAFRIGANLVLTKPINIEQAKGTLRVARGLLRKGEPAKPAAPAQSAAESAAPAAQVAAKPVPKPAPRATPATLSAASAARAVVKPSPGAAVAPSAPAASSAASAHDTNSGEIKSKPVASPASRTAMPAAPPKPTAPAVAAAEAKPAIKSTAPVSAPTFSGAASAPAPAREPEPAVVTQAAPPNTETEAPAAKHAEASEPSAPIGAEPSFTFGGANVAEASGGSKKIFLAVAAAFLVVAGLYTGWTYYQGRRSQAASLNPAPVAASQAVKPAAVPPATPSTPPATTVAQPASPKPAADTSSTASTTATSAASPTADSTESADDDNSPAPTPAKKPISAPPQSSKAAPAAKSASAPAAAPLVVKGGAVPKIKTKVDADAEAPSLMATAGAGAPPPSIVGTEGTAPKPVLQSVNVSQGVSQGLLYKKVAPVYPSGALGMHIEGAVELQATISKTGDISKIKVLSGDPQLSKAASDAVKQWKYKPYLLNGEPVEITTQVTINFKLPK